MLVVQVSGFALAMLYCRGLVGLGVAKSLSIDCSSPRSDDDVGCRAMGGAAGSEGLRRGRPACADRFRLHDGCDVRPDGGHVDGVRSRSRARAYAFRCRTGARRWRPARRLRTHLIPWSGPAGPVEWPPCASASSAPPARSAASCAILEERAPARRDAPLRLDRSAGTTLAWEASSSWSRTPRPPTCPASTSPCSPRARPPGRRELAPGSPAPGPSCRQLLGVAHGPRFPLVVTEVNRRRRLTPAEGDHRQPELHHHGAMPVLKPLHDEAGSARLWCRPTRRSRRRPRRRGRARRAGCAPVDGADESPSTARRWSWTAPVDSRRARSPSTCFRGGLARRRRLRRDRRGAEAPQREPQDPGIPELRVSCTCVRVPVFPGTRSPINAEFARPPVRAGHEC